MKLLPFENITYRTKLGESEVRQIIENNIEPKDLFRQFRSKKSDKLFEGEMYGNEFSVRRIITYRNSFLPKITGEIIDEGRERLVNVRLRLHVFVIVFLMVWFVSLLSFLLFFLITQTNNEEFETIPILILLSMLIFGYGLTVGAFFYEAAKTKKIFSRLLQTDSEYHIP